MRQVRFSKSLPAEDEAALIAFWASLDSSSLLLDEPAIHQLIVNEQARFVISLARQFQSPILDAEALLTVAHSALVAFLNQSGNQFEVIDRHLAHILRGAMIQLSPVGKSLEN